MRKIIFSILALSASLSLALASPVDKTTAENTAKAFFGSKTVSMVWCEKTTKSDALSAPSFYAFNNPSGGWVIIAGDDCCEPVLGYSYEGSFNAGKLPSNFEAWMGGISKNVNQVRKAGLAPQKEIENRWKTVGSTKAGVTSQTLLETASWGQSSPFNDKCPSKSGTHCVTGCVATAMAIVLRHNGYPTKGKGTIPSYKTSTESITVPAITLGTEYDWKNMPLTYSSSSTTAQNEAVATLMYHCGAMVSMDYCTDGSAAYSEDIIPALCKYMGYSNAARELYRFNYSNNDWLQILKSEINADRAILYGGSDAETEDGHQFVLDGYDSNNFVHINWGWSGGCNGWFAVNYLGDKSSSGVNDVFSYNDSAIIGLVPDEEGTSTSNVELSLESQSDDDLFGISLESGSIAKSSTFKLLIGFICNYDENNAYNGALKVGLYDRTGTLKEYVCGETALNIDKASTSGMYVTPGYTYLSSLSCITTKDVALGDYLMASYKLTDGSWALLGGYSSDEFTSDELYTSYKLGAIDQSYLNVPSNLTAGQVLYFDLICSHKLPSSIAWYWDNTQNSKRFVKLTSGSHALKAVVTYTDGSSETLHKTVVVE